MKKIIVSLVLLVMTGCTTMDPYTGEQTTSNTTAGAGIGAVTGALLGAAVSSGSDRGKGALIGALVGGGVGAGIGNSMDDQEAALRSELQNSGVQVRREGDRIILIMPGNITFNSGSYSVRPSFYNVLRSISIVFNKYTNTVIKISGYTDSTGSALNNQTLSEQRAASVGDYFISQNVKEGRIRTRGYGERYPVASNATDSGRAQNRRVEIEMLAM